MKIKSRPLKQKLDLQNVAAHLSDGWMRYTEFFGVTPHGTIKQFLAMLELSHVDQWQTVSRKSSDSSK